MIAIAQVSGGLGADADTGTAFYRFDAPDQIWVGWKSGVSTWTPIGDLNVVRPLSAVVDDGQVLALYALPTYGGARAIADDLNAATASDTSDTDAYTEWCQGHPAIDADNAAMIRPLVDVLGLPVIAWAPDRHRWVL